MSRLLFGDRGGKVWDEENFGLETLKATRMENEDTRGFKDGK
jgi:hypothetical protein